MWWWHRSSLRRPTATSSNIVNYIIIIVLSPGYWEGSRPCRYTWLSTSLDNSCWCPKMYPRCLAGKYTVSARLPAPDTLYMLQQKESLALRLQHDFCICSMSFPMISTMTHINAVFGLHHSQSLAHVFSHSNIHVCPKYLCLAWTFESLNISLHYSCTKYIYSMEIRNLSLAAGSSVFVL